MTKILLLLMLVYHTCAISQVTLLKYENKKLHEMTDKEFQNIFKDNHIKKGSTITEVIDILGKPSEVNVDKVTGKFSWIYDSSNFNLLHYEFTKLDHFKFVIIVFNQDEIVENFKYHIK